MKNRAINRSSRRYWKRGDEIEKEAMKTRRKKQEEREAMKSEDTVKETEKERGDLASADPLAILRPPELQTHSLFHSSSPFPLTNSTVLSMFLKIKNPNHWVLFPLAQPPPIYCREKPHWKHQAVWSKASIPINPTNRKKKKTKTSIAHVSIVCNQRTSFNFSTS